MEIAASGAGLGLIAAVQRGSPKLSDALGGLALMAVLLTAGPLIQGWRARLRQNLLRRPEPIEWLSILVYVVMFVGGFVIGFTSWRVIAWTGRHIVDLM
jgi:hypothetical protein